MRLPALSCFDRPARSLKTSLRSWPGAAAITVRTRRPAAAIVPDIPRGLLANAANVVVGDDGQSLDLGQNRKLGDAAGIDGGPNRTEVENAALSAVSMPSAIVNSSATCSP